MASACGCDQCMRSVGVVTGRGQWVVDNLISYLVMKYLIPLVSVLFGNLIPSFCSMVVINPRHACAARVTVLDSCVCVCVCVCLSAPFRPLRVKVSPETIPTLHRDKTKRIKWAIFLKFKSYGVICSLCRCSAVL